VATSGDFYVAIDTVAVGAGPRYAQIDGQYISSQFSPDGKWLIVNDPASRESRLVDATTGGDGRLLSWASGNLGGWQRLAPCGGESAPPAPGRRAISPRAQP
jgi:hypothetical protein